MGMEQMESEERDGFVSENPKYVYVLHAYYKICEGFMSENSEHAYCVACA